MISCAGQELALLPEEFDDAGVGLPHLLAGKLRNFLGEPAAVVHRRIGRKTVTAAAVVVLLAVPRGDVHQPGARLQGDVVRQDDLGVPVQPGVAADGALQGASLDPENLLPLEPPRAQQPLGQIRGHHQDFPTRVHPDIFQVRMHRDGEVRRQGPGRGGPDDQGDIFHKCLTAARLPAALARANFTKMVGVRWSSYSTSASARAVRQVAHQWMGFLLR